MKAEEAYHVNFEDYLKIDFHDWMTIRVLLGYLLPFDSNIASLVRSV